MEELTKVASELLGRDVEVEKTRDGKYVVLFMSLTFPPPPKGDTAEEALGKFIEWFKSLEKVVLPEE